MNNNWKEGDAVSTPEGDGVIAKFDPKSFILGEELIGVCFTTGTIKQVLWIPVGDVSLIKENRCPTCGALPKHQG